VDPASVSASESSGLSTSTSGTAWSYVPSLDRDNFPAEKTHLRTPRVRAVRDCSQKSARCIRRRSPPAQTSQTRPRAGSGGRPVKVARDFPVQKGDGRTRNIHPSVVAKDPPQSRWQYEKMVPCDQATFSSASAIPMPPLTHRVARPRLALRLSISCSRVTVIRVPVQPMG
jgi:hypothetical protein